MQGGGGAGAGGIAVCTGASRNLILLADLIMHLLIDALHVMGRDYNVILKTAPRHVTELTS